MGGWLRCDHGWGFAACGEGSATRDCILKDALPQSGLGAGGSAFGEAGVDGGFGARVSEKEMLDDLLDAPLAGSRSRAELGLSDVEPAKSRGNLALKLVEGGVHGGVIVIVVVLVLDGGIARHPQDHLFPTNNR